ncbi:MAG: O-methyltransferase [Phaeospirillum sp.]|nr:O-methyltransferase [Phaeospirillum sp.]
MSQPILNPLIDKYLYQLAKADDETVLKEMEGYGYARKFPMIGRVVGRFVNLLAQGMNAKRIFELGSGFGFSAYWFAKAVGPDGKVFCTDGDAENKIKAENFLKKAGLWNRIEYQTGYAQDIFQKTSGDFDIVYNDVDKGQYPGVFELVWKRIRPGGFYIADNTLWFGRVVEEKVTDDVKPGWTEAIKQHNETIFNHPEFEASIVPLRDGVLMARRK